MKTSEEIKNGLECCTPRWVANHWKSCSSKCPYITLSASCRGQLVYDALAYIQQLEAAMPKWISAKNPPDYWKNNDEDGTLVNYLVFTPDYGVDIGNYVKPANMWVVMGLPAKVTHWMELPKKPKEDA